MKIFPGLILSSVRNFEAEASYEIRDTLKRKLGVKNVLIEPVYGLSCLSIIKFSNKPEIIMNQLAEKLIDNPYMFNYVLKLVPIEIKMKSTIANIQNAAKNYFQKINDKIRWRIILRKRNSDLIRNEIIEKAAEPIERGIVDLENPELIFRIEIFGNKTFISLSKIKEISIPKIKRHNRKNN
jgi:tRNA(Ser,Leu) C12 N-acetylase TAN1